MSGLPLVGLGPNLGNSSAKVSVIQCIIRTPGLTEYFLSDKSLQEINPHNPLGFGGLLITALRNLVQAVANNSRVHETTRILMQQIEVFAPPFAGYSRISPWDFLVFLLDGLHEDTNLILRKPLTESPPQNPTTPDSELAQIEINNHKARNLSCIGDQIFGFLKTATTCSACHSLLRNVDAFISFELPVPKQGFTQILFLPYFQTKRIESCQIALDLLLLDPTSFFSTLNRDIMSRIKNLFLALFFYVPLSPDCGSLEQSKVLQKISELTHVPQDHIQLLKLGKSFSSQIVIVLFNRLTCGFRRYKSLTMPRCHCTLWPRCLRNTFSS